MNSYIVAVRSITYAMKGQTLLQSNGIKATVIRNTTQLTARGCGYGIKINVDPQRAYEILTKNGIKFEIISGDS